MASPMFVANPLRIKSVTGTYCLCILFSAYSDCFCVPRQSSKLFVEESMDRMVKIKFQDLTETVCGSPGVSRGLNSHIFSETDKKENNSKESGHSSSSCSHNSSCCFFLFVCFFYDRLS